jgi:hypothetical protein
VFSSASLDCGKGPPFSWKFSDVELIDTKSDLVPLRVTSCSIKSLTCQNSIIVGVGTASSKGTDESERNRALQRGIDLASALKRNLQESCKGQASTSVSAYVLNLGRYKDKEEADDAGQRKVIAIIGTGSGETDEAVAAALQTYVKSDPQTAHYTVCDLYKLDDAGQQALVQTQHRICDDQSQGTLSLK